MGIHEQSVNLFSGADKVSRRSEPGKRVKKFLPVNRFQQVIEGSIPDGFDGIFVEGSLKIDAEMDIEFMKVIDQVESGFPGHLHIEEDHIGNLLQDDLIGFTGSGGNGHYFNTRNRSKVMFEHLLRLDVVVNDHDGDLFPMHDDEYLSWE